MLNFLIPPMVLGIIAYGIYSIFELFVRRGERMAIIEKLKEGGTDLKLGRIEIQNSSKFTALKWGALLCGIGLGVLTGFLIASNYFTYDASGTVRISHEISSVIYGSCTLIGGGLGLLTAFLLEYKLSKKSKE